MIELQQDQSFHFTPGNTNHQSILNRLSRIEAALGITDEADDEAILSREASPDDSIDSVPLQGVWKAIAHLRIITRPSPDESVWSRPIVKQLWTSYVFLQLISSVVG